MSTDQKGFRLVDPSGQKVGSSVVGMHPLHQAAMRIADFRDGRSRLKPKDLVSLLLCHGARAWRSAQPIARPSVRVVSPAGRTAVKIRFQ
ncbi:hypothetical protein SAMN05428963_11633 [Consotaella salsifontis]|uniref:Uncharacterized protein n=1 Tax=Consotaella salsifontis TaxID=1365950 RepID=A0A1T4SZV6_9HYPH|nr:hypothetical protein SAMN05428963_11633 [Consotaella salsifontis]